jgi:hypothetical protein
VDSLTTSLHLQQAPSWESMSSHWQAKADTAVRRLNGRTAPAMLIAPILKREPDDPATGILAQLLEDATSIVFSLKLSDEVAIARGGDACAATLDYNTQQYNDPASDDALARTTMSRTSAMDNDTVADRSTEITNSPSEITSDAAEYKKMVDAAIQTVHPQLLDCGGSQRMLLLVGNESQRNRWDPIVRQAHSGALTTIVVPGVTPTLVCEAQKIKLADVRARVVSVLGGRDDVLGRLHTRCDVTWS